VDQDLCYYITSLSAADAYRAPTGGRGCPAETVIGVSVFPKRQERLAHGPVVGTQNLGAQLLVSYIRSSCIMYHRVVIMANASYNTLACARDLCAALSLIIALTLIGSQQVAALGGILAAADTGCAVWEAFVDRRT
jgi:hypothetical protein